ncbi:unnamed protein product [Camellia sinensis]
MCMQRREAVAKQEEETVGGGGEGVCVLKTSKPPHQTNAGVIDMASLLAKVTFTALLVLRVVTKPRPWKLHPQMLIKRGCFMVLESYFRYFNSLSQSSDQGEVMHLLIEAIVYVPNRNNNADIWDGVACHVCGFKISQRKRFTAPPSNFFGLFYLKIGRPCGKRSRGFAFRLVKGIASCGEKQNPSRFAEPDPCNAPTLLRNFRKFRPGHFQGGWG